MKLPVELSRQGVDKRLLRRARRVIIAQLVAGITVALLLVAVLVLAVVTREQAGAARDTVRQAVANADDVTDPPAGVWLALRTASGRVVVGKGTPAGLPDRGALAAVARDRVPREGKLRAGDGHDYLVRTGPRKAGGAAQAALDLESRDRERNRLLIGLLVGEVGGVAAAVVLGGVLAGRAIAPLGEALGRQRRFVADAAHELRTPLTLLHTRAQLVQRGLRRTPPADLELGVRADVDQLVEDMSKLGDVIEDLLLSAEMEHRPGPETVDLARLADEVVTAAKLHADEAGVTLRLHEEAPPATVRGTAGPLRRVITALVDNAVGHVSTGGHVDVTVRQERGRVLVEVRDDGVGLDPADAARVFDRFSHGETGQRRRYGLGLALVKEIVEAHGGEVDADGCIGQGAVFQVTLPADVPG